MASDDALQAYYNRDRERDRLTHGLGQLEFERTIEIMLRTFPDAPAVVADIGGGPGRYTDWLLDHGYRVQHRDVVPHHVAQVQERYETDDRVDSAVGDARSIDLADDSVDAVLLLGPLYHLAIASDRAVAIGEATRIVKPGGMVYVAAISRWAVRIQGLLVERLYDQYPGMAARTSEFDLTGVLPPNIDGGFTSYGHTPDELRAEMSHPDLILESVLAIEGVAAGFTDTDVAERLADATDRNILFDSLRALEAVPDLLGMSGHLLAVARRP